MYVLYIWGLEWFVFKFLNVSLFDYDDFFEEFLLWIRLIWFIVFLDLFEEMRFCVFCCFIDISFDGLVLEREFWLVWGFSGWKFRKFFRSLIFLRYDLFFLVFNCLLIFGIIFLFFLIFCFSFKFWCLDLGRLIIVYLDVVVLICLDILLRGVCFLFVCIICFLGCRIVFFVLFIVDCLVVVFVSFIWFSCVGFVVVEVVECGCKCFDFFFVIGEMCLVWFFIFLKFYVIFIS